VYLVVGTEELSIVTSTIIMTQVLNVIYNILAIVGVVLASVVLVYVLTVLLDKYSRFCCSRGDTLVLTPEELIERQDASQLIKRAGLAGILPHERVQIFRNFFEQRAVTYSCCDDCVVVVQGMDEGDCGHVKQSSSTTTTNNLHDTIEAQEEIDISAKPKTDTTSAAEELLEVTVTNEQELEDLAVTEHNEATCPICLSEYGS
jgi:hypothetical protein